MFWFILEYDWYSNKPQSLPGYYRINILNVQTMAKPVWDLLYISKYRYFSSCFVMANAAAKILISKETYWNMLYKNFFLDFRHLERSQIRCSKYWGSPWSVKGAIGWFQQKFGQYSLVMLYFYMVFLWLVNWLVFMLYLWPWFNVWLRFVCFFENPSIAARIYVEAGFRRIATSIWIALFTDHGLSV